MVRGGLGWALKGWGGQGRTEVVRGGLKWAGEGCGFYRLSPQPFGGLQWTGMHCIRIDGHFVGGLGRAETVLSSATPKTK